MPSKGAIVRKEKESFSVEVQSSDGNHTGKVVREGRKDGRPIAGVGMRGHEAPRLVIAPQTRGFCFGQGLSVD
jgi:hypothetical protein